MHNAPYFYMKNTVPLLLRQVRTLQCVALLIPIVNVCYQSQHPPCCYEVVGRGA
jgi:hypothetical protein